MKFVGVFTTSNGRPIDKHASIKHQNIPVPYHTWRHRACLLKRDYQNLQQNLDDILNLKIASFPGLSLRNITSKTCYAGPYANLTVAAYLSTICVEQEFSGTLAGIMLCNDSDHIGENKCAEIKIRSYFEKLQAVFENVTGFDNVKLIILSTALYRQSDFYGPVDYLERKKQFNKLLVEKSYREDAKLTVGGRNIPYAVVDMRKYLPENQIHKDKFYCLSEGNQRKIHIRGEYIERYLEDVKNIHQKFCDLEQQKILEQELERQKCLKQEHQKYCYKGRRKTSRNPFFMFCKIDIS